MRREIVIISNLFVEFEVRIDHILELVIHNMLKREIQVHLFQG